MKSYDKLYKKMILAQQEYQKSFVELDKAIQGFFKPFCDEGNSRIRINEYNSVVLRTSEEIQEEKIKDFQKKFDCKLMWEQTETVVDYRNAEGNETKITVHEFGFVPNVLLQPQELDEDDTNS